MTEEDTIRNAHLEFVNNLYMNFYETCALPQARAGSVQEAEEKFRAAVLKARAVRDRALELLPRGE